MSQRINQAVNRVTLTNVAVVRLKRNGKRYEVACYANKISQYRQGIESMEETLQTTSIFENVSKATLYRKAQLVEAFGTDDEEAICKIILDKGVAQITELERENNYHKMFRQVATLVSEMCVNSQTMRPYPVSTIETALKSTLHFSVDPSRPAKGQAIKAIRRLEKVMPLKRAQMLVKINISQQHAQRLEEKFKEMKAKIVTKPMDQAGDSNQVYKVLLDPDYFRKLSDFTSSLDPPGLLEVADFSVKKENEADVDSVNDALGRNLRLEPTAEEEEEDVGAATSSKPDDDNKQNAVKPSSNSDQQSSHVPAVSKMQQHRKNKKKMRKEQRRVEKLAAQDQDTPVEQDAASSLPDVDPVAPPLAPLTAPPTDAAAAAAAAGGGPINDTLAAPAAATGGLKCLTCKVFFGNDRTLQREHYKTDLHRVNLKLKTKGLPVLSQEEFELLGEQE